MRFLITGAAGFIGYHVSRKLMEMGYSVIGVDNESDYYSPELKQARVQELMKLAESSGTVGKFEYVVADITNDEHMERIVKCYSRVDGVCHLAAQAGVRYSMEHPKECMRTNVMGFQNVIHAFRNCPRFLYASSSSVYGNSTPPLKSPDLGTPLSPYAASKQANESLAGAYHKAFGLDVLGLRFFSVYGPWGRPDMAAFIFIEKLLAGEPVQLFNNGEMFRDWTYINDVAAATARLLIDGREVRSRVVNVAGCRSEKLVDFFQILRDMTGSLSNVDLQPMQKGDIHTTEAGDTVLDDLDICPTSLQDGLRRFVEWHRGFYPEKWENVAQERAD